MLETFLTISEVAKLLNVDIAFVRTLVQEHKLRGRKIRGQWLFVDADIRQWLQRHPETPLTPVATP